MLTAKNSKLVKEKENENIKEIRRSLNQNKTNSGVVEKRNMLRSMSNKMLFRKR